MDRRDTAAAIDRGQSRALDDRGNRVFRNDVYRSGIVGDRGFAFHSAARSGARGGLGARWWDLRGQQLLVTAASAGIILAEESQRFNDPEHAITFRRYLAFGLPFSLFMLIFYATYFTIFR